MRIADFGLVDVLAAGALRAHGVDLEIRFVDRDIDFLGLRQHRDGRRRGVDSPLRFRVRHALHAMRARFEFEPRENAAAGDLGDDLLVAAGGALACRDDLDGPAFHSA